MGDHIICFFQLPCQYNKTAHNPYYTRLSAFLAPRVIANRAKIHKNWPLCKSYWVNKGGEWIENPKGCLKGKDCQLRHNQSVVPWCSRGAHCKLRYERKCFFAHSEKTESLNLGPLMPDIWRICYYGRARHRPQIKPRVNANLSQSHNDTSNATSPVRFRDLADEIKVKILVRAIDSYDDRVKLSSVCYDWWRLSDEDAVWRKVFMNHFAYAIRNAENPRKTKNPALRRAFRNKKRFVKEKVEKEEEPDPIFQYLPANEFPSQPSSNTSADPRLPRGIDSWWAHFRNEMRFGVGLFYTRGLDNDLAFFVITSFGLLCSWQYTSYSAKEPVYYLLDYSGTLTFHTISEICWLDGSVFSVKFFATFEHGVLKCCKAQRN